MRSISSYLPDAQTENAAKKVPEQKPLEKRHTERPTEKPTERPTEKAGAPEASSYIDTQQLLEDSVNRYSLKNVNSSIENIDQSSISDAIHPQLLARKESASRFEVIPQRQSQKRSFSTLPKQKIYIEDNPDTQGSTRQTKAHFLHESARPKRFDSVQKAQHPFTQSASK